MHPLSLVLPLAILPFSRADDLPTYTRRAKTRVRASPVPVARNDQVLWSLSNTHLLYTAGFRPAAMQDPS